MSFLEKLKGVFIVPDDKAGKAQSSEAKSPAMPAGSGEYRGSSNAQPEDTETFLQILAEVIEKNDQPGFDYLEYKKAVQSIARLKHLDEPAQFKTAFAAAEALKVKPEGLIDSARKYISILEMEQTSFNQTASQFLQNQIKSKESESTELKRSISEKENQLEQLHRELEAHRSRLLAIETELSGAKAKVDANHAGFSKAYEQLVGQIRSDIQKMEQYLK